eukprot:TRINITY_DN12207_c2_g4_i6.p1 TRINITY_DN12207_c2_g4~~TRINITY_DN12207_c2_g4_i6.p1  ORF type:complete len:440 (+),score=82.75 TRINITY_DN12207_c2_g4_i6:80-1399(+)
MASPSASHSSASTAHPGPSRQGRGGSRSKSGPTSTAARYKNTLRLPIPVLNVLQDWLDANKANPYPTHEQKAQLIAQTGLTATNISYWLTQARYKLKKSGVTLESPPRGFPAHVKAQLKAWYNNHREDPKLTDTDKRELAELTGLSETQVDSWVHYTRRRLRNERTLPAIMSSSAPTSGNGAARLPASAARALGQWLRANGTQPYPSFAVLQHWQEEYGINRDQIAQWLHASVKVNSPYLQSNTAKRQTRATRELEAWLVANQNTYYPTMQAMQELMQKTRMTEESIDEWLHHELFARPDDDKRNGCGDDDTDDNDDTTVWRAAEGKQAHHHDGKKDAACDKAMAEQPKVQASNNKEGQSQVQAQHSLFSGDDDDDDDILIIDDVDDDNDKVFPTMADNDPFHLAPPSPKQYLFGLHTSPSRHLLTKQSRHCPDKRHTC